MNTNVSISDLIQYFDDKLRQIDRHRIGDNIGKEPQFPMVILFMGENGIGGFSEVYSHLVQFWPQYQNELVFLGIENHTDEIECYDLSMNNAEVVRQKISLDNLGDRVLSLFGLKSHYQDRSKLFIYYILDTTRFTNVSDFKWWMETIKKVKTSCGVDNVDLLDFLFLLLNENIGERRAVAIDIKNCLYEYLEKYVTAVMMLSNRRSDHVILEEWNIVYRMVSDIVALTNNCDTQISGRVLTPGVFTASYEFEEKPTSQIGQVIIRELIEKLSNESFDPRIAITRDNSLDAKLGLSSEKTLNILDEYAQQALYKLLPNEDKLILFPRRDTVEYDNLSFFSEREFNEITMNSWKCYLDQIVFQAQEHIRRDSSMRIRWKEEYSNTISNNFSIGELIWMKDHLDEIRNLLNDARRPNPEKKVLSAAKSQLRFLLSSNPSIMDIFVSEIEALGKNAESFLESWQKLLRSRLKLHSVRDENLKKFYEQKATLFFDYNGTSIKEQFSYVSNMEELKMFFEDIIDRIIDSDPVFSSAFEEELESRLNEESEQKNAKQYIRDILTGHKVPIYFQSNFHLGQPVVSAILLNVGTPLYRNLSNNLSPTTYYYNTGSSNAAEALNIYEVGKDNLIKG